jgi:hypothetical protein
LANNEAVVEKVLGPKLFLVSLEDGTKLTARGSSTIIRGMKVQVLSLLSLGQKESEDRLNLDGKNGNRLSFLIPFKLGNKTPEAKIDLYVDREKTGSLYKKDKIVYLIFQVKTAIYGQIQWVVYLKGKSSFCSDLC